MTLDALILARAEEHADRPLLVEPQPGEGAVVSTFGEVIGDARKVAGWLAGKGTRGKVALILPGGRGLVAAMIGAILAGWVAVPIDPRLKPPEVRFLLAHTGCEAVIGAGGTDVNAVIREGTTWSSVIPTAPLDPAVILATSGSTADPKAVVLTHRSILHNVRGFRDRIGYEAGDRFLSNLSLVHSFGMTACLFTAIDVGASLILVDDPQPVRVSALAARHRPTAFFATASFYQYLVRGAARAVDFAEVRCFLAGACALPAPVAAQFRAKFGRDIVQTYGLTEASPVVTANPPADNRLGTVGTALAGIDLAVAEDGELLVRGDSVMRGYLDNPAATAACLDAEGWLRTGDLAAIDEEGYVTILGRKKDLIIRGGAKLFPEEIEEALLKHPSVAEACVVGLSDPVFEEIPVALIVPASPAGIDAAALADHCRAALALYKVPRIFRAVPALPRNPNGKILRRAARALAGDPSAPH